MSNENTQIAIYDGVEIEQAVYMAAFAQENGLQDIIDQISAQAQAKAAEIPSDMSALKNRKALKSLAAKVASAKTDIDDTGKKLVEDVKAQIKIVDNNRKAVRDQLDDVRDMIKKPALDWEAEEEEAKKAAIQVQIQSIQALSQAVDENGNRKNSTQLRADFEQISQCVQDDNADIQAAAKNALNQLEQHIQAAEQHEAQQAEIAKLEAEKAQREKAEHEAKIAAEAAEKAKREAEAKAQAERELMERAKIEAQLKAEAAEREKQAMLERMEAEKQAAAEAERQRLAAEQRAKEEAEAKRAADENHIRQINREIYAEMLACGIPEQAAQAFLLKLQNGEVPHLKVCY